MHIAWANIAATDPSSGLPFAALAAKRVLLLTPSYLGRSMTYA